MDVRDRVVVVTGGGSGLGAACARRFAADGARVAVADLDRLGCEAVAAETGGIAIETDVGVEDDVRRLVDVVTDQLGPIDVFFSNAGVGTGGDVFAPDHQWQTSWQVHVMASVYAARAVLPAMLERGEGYLLGTASGAALTAEPGILAYSVTKHAMLDLYEVMAITYGHLGIRVSCFCPFGMLTPMLLGDVGSGPIDASGSGEIDASRRVGLTGAVTAETAADAVAAGVRDERFLILSHPEALTFFQRKAGDYERWLRGMRRVYAGEPTVAGPARPTDDDMPTTGGRGA